METLEAETRRLFNASLAKNTWTSYDRCLDTFNNFRALFNLDSSWPASLFHVVSFISFLSVEGWAPSSINCHISALAFFHKINSWLDPTNHFLITKLKEGCKRLNRRVDGRLPITPSILSRLIRVLPALCQSDFEIHLFKASFLVSFFGFLRLSEFTAKTKLGDNSRVLSYEDVTVLNSQSLKIRIRFSKTDQVGHSTSLIINACSDPILCPVKAVSEFLIFRPNCPGPLFRHFNGEPLTSSQFSVKLKQGIRLLGLCPKYYSSHSFRIGAATTAATAGMSDSGIKSLGRWRSNSFQLYIRP